jgi:hypothetical protein
LNPKAFQKFLIRPNQKQRVIIEIQKERKVIKQIGKKINETLRKDPKCYLNIPQPQEHISMANILTQSLLQKR